MKKIASFEVDHDILEKGFYLSRVDGDVFTYDLRFKKPNGGDYLLNAAMHTIEHLMATVARNSDLKESVIYFGPMGCRTGFYLLLRNVEIERAKTFTVESLKKCLEQDAIPGSEKKECGNYLEHDLAEAKKEIADYLKILTAAKENSF